MSVRATLLRLGPAGTLARTGSLGISGVAFDFLDLRRMARRMCRDQQEELVSIHRPGGTGTDVDAQFVIRAFRICNSLFPAGRKFAGAVGRGFHFYFWWARLSRLSLSPSSL